MHQTTPWKRAVAVGIVLLAFIQTVSALPKVYIVGDSRTCGDGYVKYMGTYVKDVAEVTCVPIDRFVGEVIPKIGQFKGAAMVHFMGGLDDVSCLDRAPTSERQHRYDEYIQEMKTAIDKMKADLPGTIIVHATMFHVASCSQSNYKGNPASKGEQEKWCDGTGCRRRNEDIVKFNSGSVKVATDKGIRVHDLYSFARSFSQSDQRHFETDGKVAIAKEVAGFIKARLGSGTPTNAPVTKIVAPLTTGVVEGASYTFRGEGANLVWEYDVNSDGKGNFAMGTGSSATLTVPTGATGPRELTVFLTGDNGSDKRVYTISAGATAARPAFSSHFGAERRSALFDLQGRCARGSTESIGARRPIQAGTQRPMVVESDGRCRLVLSNIRAEANRP